MNFGCFNSGAKLLMDIDPICADGIGLYTCESLKHPQGLIVTAAKYTTFCRCNYSDAIKTAYLERRG